MVHQLRVCLEPLESAVSTEAQRLFDGAIVSLQGLGQPSSLLTGVEPQPARLRFSGKFFRSVRREDEAPETRELATIEGEVRRSASGELTFAPSASAEQALVPSQAAEPSAETDEQQPAPEADKELERGLLGSPDRLLRFGFAQRNFPSLASSTGKLLDLPLVVDRRRHLYLEVTVALELGGAPEASPELNDRLDVLITASNPPEACPCDDCKEVGPAAFEPEVGVNEPGPDATPPEVGLGDRRKAVGLGQVLLDDLIAQLRLGMVELAPRGNADALRERLKGCLRSSPSPAVSTPIRKPP